MMKAMAPERFIVTAEGAQLAARESGGTQNLVFSDEDVACAAQQCEDRYLGQARNNKAV